MDNQKINIDTIRFLAELLNEPSTVIQQSEAISASIVLTSSKITQSEIEKLYPLLSVEPYGANGVEILLNKTGKRVFSSTDNFLARFSLDDIEYNFGILQQKGSFLFYEADTQKVYNEKNEEVTTNTIIQNARAYQEILKLLRNDATEDKFCSYDDSVRYRIVILVPEKGRINIDYARTTPQIPQIDDSLHLPELQKRLADLLEKPGFTQFFKGAVFDALKNVSQNENFTELVKGLPILLNTANSNFEVYLSGFSFKKLSDDLRKEKEEYFKSTRELLGKLYTQVVTVPVSFSVATFAGRSANDSLLFMIVLGFILYTTFVEFLLVNFYREIQDIAQDFDADDLKIKTAFLQFQAKEKVESELDKIRKRIAVVKGSIIAFGIYVLFVAGSMIAASIFEKTNQQPLWIISTLIACVISVVVYFVMSKPKRIVS